MINVLFFASYREQLGCDTLTLESGEYPASLNALKAQLAEKGANWHRILTNPKTLTALNQTMVRRNEPLKAGDEVAFFPPVTGG